ncbi:MAG: efflux RND transporter permease subunit [Planctomycetia bacterium]|nr:efflux RND transporter permease subunit [Planctomycetia bacterium]
MLARFFIDRPIFAWVISIVIVLGGAVAAIILPVAQYPEITPPSVTVTCQYPGASAVVVSQTVAAPIEQQVNGVEGMLYMSSQCTNDGTYSLTVTFNLGVNLNMAQVLVQNRVAQAMATLPDAVKLTGVTTKKKSPSILLVVNLYSEKDEETGKAAFDQLYLSNYATIQLRDQLARLEGVGDVTMLGQQDYSMRVWVDPEKLASRNLTAGDVTRVLKEQNVQVAAGRLGAPPVPSGQAFQYTLTTLGRLLDQEQFENIVVKTGTTGQVTYLRDVARIELGAKNMDVRCRLDGSPSVGLAIYQLPGSNALNVADSVRAKMKELSTRFPKALRHAIVYDTTPFVRESVMEVIKTLRDAVILVCLVVLFFLQDWRSVILPLIDVIVSLIGTFAVMYAVSMFGYAVGLPALQFSLNNLTLFGLVLAIGIVVDDAIVVLENIERWMGMGYPVRDATIHAMDEITGPILAITLVLASVFLPSAFLGGITGQFYRQFALTIAASMIISAINAMTMTPARAASVFGHRKPGAHDHSQNEALPWWGTGLFFGYLATFGQPLVAATIAPLLGINQVIELTFPQWLLLTGIFSIPGAIVGVILYKPVNWVLAVIFKGFNRLFDAITTAYGRFVAWCLRLSLIVLFVYGGLIVLTGYSFLKIPIGFIPSQDKGYLLVNIELPDAASLERSEAVVDEVEAIARSVQGVRHTLSVPGMSFVLGGAISSNWASIFIILDEFENRHGHHEGAEAIATEIRKKASVLVKEARVAVYGAPAVDGLGNAGGFKLMIQDRGDLGLVMLQGQADNFAEKGMRVQGIAGLFNGFRATTPQKYLDIDRVKCKTIGLALNDVFETLQVFLGGAYVNDFNRFGRTWQVNVQADAAFRLQPETIRGLKVRNDKGEMIPLGSVVDVLDINGPVLVNRYNMFPAAPINGGAFPGVSTGEIIQQMEALAQSELNPSMGFEWTELTLMQKLAGSSAIFAFIGAVVLVYLVLAALYESWSLPMAVLLVVPMCLLSALAGIALAKMDINIFVQVGFIVLVGLAAKNAILIVEFAEEKRHKDGFSVFDAAVAACVSRLRPIIMTSFAFILGVVPLVIAHGAGAEMRQTLGVAVFSGMLGVTFFGLFLTPVFYFVIRRKDPTPISAEKVRDSVPSGVSGVSGDAIQTAPKSH